MARRVELEDLLHIAWPLDPALSPRGDRLAFVRSRPCAESDRLAYQLMAGEVGEREFRELGTQRTRHPSWSPSGSLLAFVHEDPSGWQLATSESSTGGLNLGTASSNFDWLGDEFLFAVAEREGHACGLKVSASEPWAEAVQFDLAGLAPHIVSAAPSEDSIAIASTNTGTGEGEVWVVDVRDGTRRLLWSRRGPVHRLCWSPDGSRLGVLVNPMSPGLWANHEIWVLDVDGGGHSQLGEGLDLSFGQAIRGDDERGLEPVKIEWVPESDAVYSVVSVDGRSGLGMFQIDGGYEVTYADEGSILDFTVAKQTGDVVVSWSSSLSPGELSMLRGSDEQRITEINAGWLESVVLTPNQPIELDSGAQGWLTVPSDSVGQTPLVVQVHGGPHFPIGERFSFDSQRFASYGLATLRSNPRGSQGYGAEFARAVVGDWGGADHDDIASLTDVALGDGSVAERPVAIIGESYGGYMANLAITKGDQYDVAVAENGVSDLVSMASGPRGESFWHPEMGGAPSENPALYSDRSPLEHVSKVGASVLLIHAEDDDNVPLAQSLMFYEALLEAGADVSIETIPNEGHMINVFGKPSSRMVRTKKLDAFLREHLIADEGVENDED